MKKPYKFFNKKENKWQWRVRFEINNKTFRPVADSRQELLDLVDELRIQERRVKHALPVPDAPGPTLEEFFAKAKDTCSPSEQNTLARASKVLLSVLLQETGRKDLLVTELKRAHLQAFLEMRQRTVKIESANREMTALAAALHRADRLYPALEDWICPKIPRFKAKRQRRERLLTPDEIHRLLAYLTRPTDAGETPRQYFHRVRLAHTIEFALLTGLRRKEYSTLKFSQYDTKRRALLNVHRWKTGTTTKFFPLPARAVEIIEARRKLQGKSEYIFTPDGKPVEANYRTLKIVCPRLGINYGALTDGGFTLHDARHNFASEIIKITDIETARELTGHAGEEILTYLHTSEDELIKAMRAFEARDITEQLREIFAAVQSGTLAFGEFAAKIKTLVQ